MKNTKPQVPKPQPPRETLRSAIAALLKAVQIQERMSRDDSTEEKLLSAFGDELKTALGNPDT